MAVTFHPHEGEALEAVGGQEHDPEHGQQGYGSENGCHPDHADQAVLGRGDHQDRDQGLTGAEDENGEEDPGGEPGFAI